MDVSARINNSVHNRKPKDQDCKKKTHRHHNRKKVWVERWITHVAQLDGYVNIIAQQQMLLL